MTLSKGCAAAAFLFALGTANAGVGKVQAPAIFVKAVRAADHLTYSGERIVEIRDGANRRTHREYVLHQGMKSRVWFPPGSQFGRQVIIETASERLHFYPGRGEVEVLPSKREDAFIRIRNWISKPNKAVRLSVAGSDRIAGRPVEIGVIADARGNVRQRLWIDVDTGMVLKREILDNVGARQGFFEFTQIDYHPAIRPGDFAINVRGVRRLGLAEKARRLSRKNGLADVVLQPGHGFKLEGVNVVRPGGLLALHEAYSGPRGRLSLFQMAGNVDLQAIRRASGRDLQFFGWQAGGNSFALVGSYSQEQLRSLARLVVGSGNAP